jgi:uncharacterized coiled-coil DUF342 family protein
VSDDFEAVRARLEGDSATSARNQALAALARIETRLREVEAERDDAQKKAKWLQLALNEAAGEADEFMRKKNFAFAQVEELRWERAKLTSEVDRLREELEGLRP